MRPLAPLLPLPYRALVPAVEVWVRYHEDRAAARAEPLAEDHIRRLSSWYSADLLQRVRVVSTEDLPRVPLPSLGIRPLRDLLRGTFSGLTLRDTVFVRPDRRSDTALFFHELVHVLQWEVLGLRPFIHRYGLGLLEGGYRGCPLEVMAYELEGRFRNDAAPFDVGSAVRLQLGGAA